MRLDGLEARESKFFEIKSGNKGIDFEDIPVMIETFLLVMAFIKRFFYKDGRFKIRLWEIVSNAKEVKEFIRNLNNNIKEIKAE